MNVKNKIGLREFSWSDIEGISLVLYKKEKDKLFSPSKGNTMTILLENKPIGLIDLTCFEEGFFNIDMFEVFDKRKGYGQMIVRELQKCPDIKKLSLNPHDKGSYDFWIKMGFKLFKDGETMGWQK